MVLELVGGVEGVVGAAVRPDEHHAPRKVVVARAVLLGLFPAEPSGQVMNSDLGTKFLSILRENLLGIIITFWTNWWVI